MAPEKLGFQIYRCSGEDPEHPARELLLSAAQPRGWHSQKMCKYPQELVLKLDRPSRVTQIQILSHEHKIPTKVEIFTGMPQEGLAPEPQNCSMKKLGHLSFDSNERSNHQARELKSVHINTKALLLRFVLQECHVNRLNSYNQVGIVAINIKGEPMGEYNGAAAVAAQQALHNLNLSESPVDRRPMLAPHSGPKPVMPFSLQGFDPLTASIIAEVQRAKGLAVEQEDYDEAKRLKAKIDYMKRIGAQIAELEAQKRSAVEEEDYDTAKSLKMEIGVLRRRLEGQPTAASPLHLQSVPAGVPTPGATMSHGSPVGAVAAESSPVSAEQEVYAEPPAPPVPVNPLSPERDVSYDHLPYDERPAQAKGMMNAFINTPDRFKSSPPVKKEEGGDSSTPMAIPPMASDMQEMMSEAGSRPGEPDLEALSGSDEKNASVLYGLLGEEAARCIYSKHWQLREKGLSQAIDIITSDGIDGDVREGFRLISNYVLGKTLKDKVAHIIQSSVDLMRELLEHFGSQVGNREVQHIMLELVPILIDRVGESNGIIRDRAFEAILMLSDMPEVGNGGVLAASLVKPIKRQSQWKPILSRLNLLNELLPKFGLYEHKTDKGDYSHGFTVDAVMNFVNPAFSSANEDVRKSAIQVARIVMDTVGEQMERILPSDLNPFLKDAILGDGISHAIVKRSPAPKPKSTPKPKPVTSNNRSASKQSASAKKQAAPKPAKRNTPKPDKENILPQADPEPEPEPEPLSQVEMLEQEIASREAKYGPNHVEVGHALVDLAVLLSEEGRPDDSVPLYERALTVYEEAEGSESSNVAQTLTDLAVIHIEAGRDDIGKPQLERAQSILEKELGPDHEDVQAIKDVLDNLDDKPQEED